MFIINLKIYLIFCLKTSFTRYLRGLSLLCVFWWLCKLHLVVNPLLQVWQTKGFSFVCVLIWMFKRALLLKTFLQTSHLCDLLSSWILLWFWRLGKLEYFLWQTLQSNFFSFITTFERVLASVKLQR